MKWGMNGRVLRLPTGDGGVEKIMNDAIQLKNREQRQPVPLIIRQTKSTALTKRTLHILSQ